MNQCCELGLKSAEEPKRGERRVCTECGQKWVRLGGGRLAAFWWPTGTEEKEPTR